MSMQHFFKICPLLWFLVICHIDTVRISSAKTTFWDYIIGFLEKLGTNVCRPSHYIAVRGK